jgi:hypothetical protein
MISCSKGHAVRKDQPRPCIRRFCDGQAKSRPDVSCQACSLERKYQSLAFRWMTCLACGGETLKLSM